MLDILKLDDGAMFMKDKYNSTRKLGKLLAETVFKYAMKKSTQDEPSNSNNILAFVEVCHQHMHCI